MYRFLLRPKWIGFHLLVLAAVVVMVSLGLWQLRRLDARQEFNEQVRTNAAAEVVALGALLPPPTATITPEVADELEWRTVAATGEYLADDELLVVNRSQDGQAGDVVLTPLLLDDGRVLLVERGFVPLDTEGLDAPAGVVEVVGRLRRSATRGTGQLTDRDEDDDQIPRVDIAALAPDLAGPPVPMYVELVRSSPATDGYPTPLDPPELTDGPHLSYAVQWFIFSACVVGGWVLAVRHSVRSSRRTQRSPSEVLPPEV